MHPREAPWECGGKAFGRPRHRCETGGERKVRTGFSEGAVVGLAGLVGKRGGRR